MPKINSSYFFKVLKWIKRNPAITGGAFGLLSFLCCEIAYGIVENYSYELFNKIVLPWLNQSTSFKNYTLIFFLIVFFLIFILFGKKNKRDSTTKTICDLNLFSEEINFNKLKIYWELMKEINQIIQFSMDDSENKEIGKIIDKYFLTIFKFMGVETVHGGGILLPDENDPDWLYFWRMSPDQPWSTKRFYIGDSNSIDENSKHRGTAGTTFLDGVARIVRIKNRNKGNSDEPTFHKFEIERPIIPYESFIVFPIHWNKKTVGVITIESQKQDSFKEDDILWMQCIINRIGDIFYYFKMIR